MTRALRSIAILAFVLLYPMVARATTSSCSNAIDGTPCIDSCVAQGTCQNHICKPGVLRPNGTACSSEDTCTEDDTCQAGVCMPGPRRVCPDIDACLRGVCNENSGCGIKNVCPPDLAGQDLTGQPPPPDLLGLDLIGVDLCTVPIGSEFYTCDEPDLPPYVPRDAGTDANASEPTHVRGSRVGDCDFSGGAERDSAGIALLLGGILVLCWRIRRAI